MVNYSVDRVVGRELYFLILTLTFSKELLLVITRQPLQIFAGGLVDSTNALKTGDGRLLIR